MVSSDFVFFVLVLFLIIFSLDSNFWKHTEYLLWKDIENIYSPDNDNDNNNDDNNNNKIN